MGERSSLPASRPTISGPSPDAGCLPFCRRLGAPFLARRALRDGTHWSGRRLGLARLRLLLLRRGRKSAVGAPRGPRGCHGAPGLWRAWPGLGPVKASPGPRGGRRGAGGWCTRIACRSAPSAAASFVSEIFGSSLVLRRLGPFRVPQAGGPGSGPRRRRRCPGPSSARCGASPGCSLGRVACVRCDTPRAIAVQVAS